MIDASRRLPSEFLERLERICRGAHSAEDGASLYARALRTLSAPRPVSIRINPLGRLGLSDPPGPFGQTGQPDLSDPPGLSGDLSRRHVLEAFSTLGIDLQPVEWYYDAFVVVNADARRLTGTDLYDAGAFYIQSLSSMLPPLALNPSPGNRVLDMTAAPGSKTTQLAALMRDRGELIANDNHRGRCFKLRANLARMRVTCARVTTSYGESLWKRYGESFDAVLLDAPCSVEGRFSTRDPKSFRYWKPRKIHEMARKQKRLLYSAVQALKPGGSLVYSTCTFAPEENEGVIDWALRQFGDALDVAPAHLPGGEALPDGRPLPGGGPGLVEWDGTSYDARVARTTRIAPSDLMDGFFIAKLRKLESTVEGG